MEYGKVIEKYKPRFPKPTHKKKAKKKGIKKLLSLTSLDKKLWRIVSEYIRRRDSNYAGICLCITCGTAKHWKEMDAGHFIARDKKSTKFDVQNISAQCKWCNRFKSGKQYEMSIYIDQKYGEGTANILLIKSKQPVRRKRFDYEFLIKEFKEKLERIK